MSLNQWGNRYSGPFGARPYASTLGWPASGGWTSAAGNASITWPSANLAIYIPILLELPIIVKQLWNLNGATVAGTNNIDVGLYSADGRRIVSAGSTVQTGTNTMQAYNVTDTQIGPGLYYMGIAIDNTTDTINGQVYVAAWGKLNGFAEEASALPLPATATFATYTQAVNPCCGVLGDAI